MPQDNMEGLISNQSGDSQIIDKPVRVNTVDELFAKLGELDSSDPNAVAEGVDAFLELQKIFEASLQEPVNEVAIARRAQRFADFIAHLKGAQIAENATVLTYQQRPSNQPWDTAAREAFMRELNSKGILKPPSHPAQITSPPPAVGK